MIILKRIDKHLFNSIPNFILKTKNIYENKAANQIDLFGADEEQDNEIILNIEDWKFEDTTFKRI